MLNDTVFSKSEIRQLRTILKKAMDDNIPHPRLQNSIPGIVIVTIVILAIIFVARYHTKRKPLEKLHKENIGSAAIWFLIAIAFFFGLSQFNLIHMKDWVISDGDLLLIFSIVVGIIGCVWAIYARVDAERAFHEANRAHVESSAAYQQAKATYESFGSSFDFGTSLSGEQ